MVHTSTNVETKPTLKRDDLTLLDLANIQIALQKAIEISYDFKETLEKVESIIDEDCDTYKRLVVERLLRKDIKELTLENIASILDIGDRNCLNIHGLDYYYGDGMIGAFVPQTNDMRYSWVNGQDFIECHGIESMDDLKEYMR